MGHEDLYQQIEKRRGDLLATIEDARKARDEANEVIRSSREELEQLPRQPIRRRTKAETSETEPPAPDDRQLPIAIDAPEVEASSRFVPPGGNPENDGYPTCLVRDDIGGPL